MEKIINQTPFVNLRNDMDEVINQFKCIENDVNQNVYEKYQLYQYEQIIERKDKDVFKKNEAMYNTFSKVVVNKKNSIQQTSDLIKQFNDMISYIKKLTDTNNMNLVINKEMNNADEMIKCLNKFVDKIIGKETTIFKRKEDEFEKEKENQQRKQEFEEKIREIEKMKFK